MVKLLRDLENQTPVKKLISALPKMSCVASTVEPIFWHSRFFMSCSDRAKIASFCTFLMKLGFRTCFMFLVFFVFRKNIIWKILIIFSTFLLRNLLGTSTWYSKKWPKWKFFDQYEFILYCQYDHVNVLNARESHSGLQVDDFLLWNC